MIIAILQAVPDFTKLAEKTDDIGMSVLMYVVAAFMAGFVALSIWVNYEYRHNRDRRERIADAEAAERKQLEKDEREEKKRLEKADREENKQFATHVAGTIDGIKDDISEAVNRFGRIESDFIDLNHRVSKIEDKVNTNAIKIESNATKIEGLKDAK